MSKIHKVQTLLEAFIDIAKNADEKSIADNLLQSKHSDINLEEIMMKDVNISPWLRFGVERNPWQDCELHCLPRLPLIDKNSDPILKPEEIIANSKNLRQTPDKKFFALTKLELNNKGLEDISFLSMYRCFQYIDLSWNRLKNLEALNEMVYLIYLDASHNSLQIAICMEAPWYLTYMNLSHNDISTIGDLSKFWSLQNINFSHNKIDCIQGFKNLKYLRCLDLSYNKIKCLENIGYLPLTYLNLEGNEISDWKETEKEDAKEINSENSEISDCEETGKRDEKEEILESRTLNEEFEENGGTAKGGVVINPDMREINLKNNLLQSMEPFKNLVLLEQLNLGNNKIEEFVEIDYLKNKKMLKHLTLRGNHVSTINSYRILLLHYIPNLDSIDGDCITMAEREIVYKLQNIDSTENKYELLSRKIFYEQLASVDYTIPGIVAMNDTCLPLIAIVGPFGSFRNELIEKLVNNHSEKLYYARNHICIPEEITDLVVSQQDTLIPRSQFNRMMASGQFLATSYFLGVEFGLSKIEYNKGVEAGKMVISLCDLTMAFCLQALGVNTRAILCITDSIELMNQRIQSQCEDLLQERDTFHPSIIPLSYKLLMQNWPCGHTIEEKQMQVQEFSSSKQSLTEPSIKIESSLLSMSRYIEAEREQTVINFIQSRVIQTRNLYDEIKNCDSFIETVYTDNFDGAYKSLKSTLRNASDFISSGMCSLHVENLYETIQNLQRKAIIEELNQSDQNFHCKQRVL